ncbi:MAG: hypothetical protein EBS19_16355, partial [Spirochaetia bacterium]|nr:hypothetical protein [Spirochaetia bacterium]
KNGSDTYYTAGKVGIGTNSPTETLHVNSLSGNFRFSAGSQGGTPNLQLSSTLVSNKAVSLAVGANASSLNYDNTGAFYINRDTYSNIYNTSFSGISAIPVATFSSSGNVGIGNTSPTELMQIGDLSNTTSGRRVLSFGASGFDFPGAYNVSSSGDKIILWNSSSGFQGDARIGIGPTSTFWFKMNSNGSYRWYENNVQRMMLETSTGNLSITGSLSQNSDLRKKRNISGLTNSIDIINKLRPVKYFWKREESSDESEHYGFIAQEVERVLPSIVTTDDKGFKSLDYISMIPFMIDSLQKINQIKSNQNLSIKSLEAENKELTQKLNMEKDKIRNLEKENLEIRKQLGEL